MIQRIIPNEIRNRRGERLDFIVHPGDPGISTLVVLGHGVTGNKDRPLLITLAEALAREGITALRFSFSGNGESEGEFEESNISKQVEDLGGVLKALPGWHVGYAGHSMGAAVGVLLASVDSRIRFLVSLAGMAHPAAFAQREFGTLIPGASFMWDKAECPLTQTFMDDMARVESVVPGAARVDVPWLFVHGTEDDVVPAVETHELFRAAQEPKQWSEIPGADHVFSGVHAEQMSQSVVAWMKQLRL